jgi:hypothetical protein
VHVLSSCLSVGTRQGYKIYKYLILTSSCDPFGKCFGKREGGIGIVEMLFCTSLVALVGCGEHVLVCINPSHRFHQGKKGLKMLLH